MKKLWSVAVLVAAAVSLHAAVIFEKGAVKAQIVIPSNANAVERFAAKELAYHLKLIGGKDVAVVSVPSADLQQIRLGRAARLDISKLPVNGALVKIGKDTIDIAGKDGNGAPLNFYTHAGTLLGVYEFLEREAAVRWLWPGELGVIAPEKSDFALAAAQYLVDPPLESAVWRASTSTAGWVSKQLGAKFQNDKIIWLRRHRFVSSRVGSYGHAYVDCMKLYGKTKPEIFNLLPDGTRSSDPMYFNGRDDLISMCVSNPEVVRITVERWQKQGGFLNVNENDTAGKCVCANCLALDNNPDKGRVERAKKRFAAKDKFWYTELGSLSDRYAAFYMAVQKEADKIDPNSRMVGCIYGNYYEAPTKVKLNERVIMRFCPPIMYPWTDAKIAMFKKLWKGWSDAGVSLMLRPNFTHDGHNFPLMYHRQFAECFDFARDNSLKLIDYDSLTGVFGANGVTCYVIAAKNYSGKDKSVTELENEYLAAFGKAAPAMRKFMEVMIAATAKGYTGDDKSVEGSSHYASFYEVAGLVFTPEVMAQGRKLLTEAENAAAGDPVTLARVKFVRAGFDDAALVLDVQNGVVHFKKTGEAIKAADAMRKLSEFRKNHEHIGYVDLNWCVSREGRKWPMHLAQLGGDSRQLIDWQITFDPEETGVKNQWFVNAPAGAAVTTDDHMENGAAYKAFFKGRRSQRVNAWYINKFTVKSVNPAQQLKLTFGAVDGNADVYLNGELILSRKYPHKGDGDSWKKPFDIDVTGKIKAGENLLAVHISKDRKFGGLSGIWRSVFLSRGSVEVESLSAKGWKNNYPQGKFKGESRAYPLKLICTAPAAKRNHAYKGVWGRFFRTEKLIPGKRYEIKINFKQTGDARLELWVRSGKGGLGQNNINVASPNENNIERTMTARFVAGSDKCTIYVNLLKGVGELDIYSVKMYQVSEL